MDRWLKARGHPWFAAADEPIRSEWIAILCPDSRISPKWIACNHRAWLGTQMGETNRPAGCPLQKWRGMACRGWFAKLMGEWRAFLQNARLSVCSHRIGYLWTVQSLHGCTVILVCTWYRAELISSTQTIECGQVSEDLCAYLIFWQYLYTLGSSWKRAFNWITLDMWCLFVNLLIMTWWLKNFITPQTRSLWKY